MECAERKNKIQTIHELFERQVEETPDKIAVICEENRISYKELNSRANQLAVELRTKGIKCDDIIGIMLNRSIEMIIGIIGILKAGAAFMPIAPDLPKSRIEYMLKDSKALVSNDMYKDTVNYSGEILDINDKNILSNSCENINTEVSGENLLYIIYTSGTTGNPKGVMIEHRNLLNLIEFEYEDTNIQFDEKVLQFTTNSFDVCYQEIFSTLLAGGQLFIISDEDKQDVEMLFDFISKNNIKNVFLPTSYLKFILGIEEYLSLLPTCIKNIITAGEQLIITDALREYIVKNDIVLHNHYGPAETHVVTTFTIDKSSDIPDVPPIGRPIKNDRVYILDENKNPQPLGVVGELYISGKSVGRGYLNREDLTNEKFLQDPYFKEDKMYKTGDLAKWNNEGVLEYIGRADFQVKIRGFRIEIGEVEAAIANYKDVKEVIVLAKENNKKEKYLCAYMTTNTSIDSKEIRKYLSEKIPAYMIPTYFMVIDSIPLTHNQKVDRGKLPEPQEVEKCSVQECKLDNDVQRNILKIWRDTLQIGDIGLDDNFFDIGGNSFLLLKVQVKINKIYPNKLRVIDLFKLTSIRMIANYINKDKEIIVNKKVNKNSESHLNDDVAIIGIGIKMPGADTIDEFWTNIEKGKNCVRGIPDERKKLMEGVVKYKEDILNFRCSYIDDIDKFDYKFFSILKNEANLIDPAQRMFLQVAWKAIEDAGYNPLSLAKSKTGVYLGYNSLYSVEYLEMVSKLNKDDIRTSILNNVPMMTASRISYILDLRGPAMIVDTACSGSLIAMDLACQSIRNGKCDMALVGGAKVNLSNLVKNESLGIESPEGITKAFDDSSNGTGLGEGVIAYLLKPLKKAVEDNDHIYSVIKSIASNQDGNSIGITAPNPEAQEELIEEAWNEAGINPEDVGYIEAHGTGTILGDPIEIEGISRAFSKYTNRKQFCAVSSVKTNLGHLDNVAGIAGVLRAVLALKNKKIPANIHFKTPNRNINFVESPVYVNSKLKEWKVDNHPRICGVSSFGMGGTNCHVVLQEYDNNVHDCNDSQPYIFTVSAKSKKSLKMIVDKYKEFFGDKENCNLRHIAFTVNTGREHFSKRIAFVVNNFKELKDKINFISNNDSSMWNKEEIYFGENDVIVERSGQLKEGNINKITEGELEELNKLSEEIINNIEDDKYDGKILKKLCEVYVKGAAIRWNVMFDDKGDNKRISLPTYEFEKESCWVFNNSSSNDNDVDLFKVASILRGKEDNNYSQYEKEIGYIFYKVMGLDSINIYNSFYEVGGNSIIAFRIINLINNRFNTKFNINELLENPSVFDFAKYFEESKQKDKNCIKILKADEREYYPLSPAQKRIFVSSGIKDKNTNYNIPMVFEIRGNLNVEKIEKALNKVIQNNEMLRTYFKVINRKAVQAIDDNAKLKVDYIKLNTDGKEDVRKYIEEEIKRLIRPFQLDKAPLIRVSILSVNDSKNLMFMDIHHIITDGTSIDIFIDEFKESYIGGSIEKPSIEYKDYAVWINEFIKTEEMKEQENYWLSIFEKEAPVLDIPIDNPRPDIRTSNGNVINRDINDELYLGLKELARKTEATLYMVLLSVYNTLLYRYTNQEDIVIGCPISGRVCEGVENVFGMFVNTLPMRNYPKGNKTFKELLEDVKKCCLDAYKNQIYQFDSLIEKLNIKRELNRTPLIETLLVLQNESSPELDMGDISFKSYEYKTGGAKFDITMEFLEESGLKLKVEYASDIFEKATIETMIDDFINIISQILTNQNVLLKEIVFENLKIKDKNIIDKDIEFNF
ncbi:MAG: amino acid adenylation domain-containing protein [Clostridium sp.]|nr:amino acid adenylation domain-containing protein [Clostridium sp.]